MGRMDPEAPGPGAVVTQSVPLKQSNKLSNVRFSCTMITMCCIFPLLTDALARAGASEVLLGIEAPAQPARPPAASKESRATGFMSMHITPNREPRATAEAT